MSPFSTIAIINFTEQTFVMGRRPKYQNGEEKKQKDIERYKILRLIVMISENGDRTGLGYGVPAYDTSRFTNHDSQHWRPGILIATASDCGFQLEDSSARKPLPL